MTKAKQQSHTSAPDKSAGASKMWGGRFDGGPAGIMEEINASISFDHRLYAQDIAASKAHARMLCDQGIVTQQESNAIGQGLDQIFAEIEAGTFPFERALEDIHMNVESRLKTLIGESAGKLHTARSRNDQVATDFKLWVRGAIDRTDAALQDLQNALVTQAESHAGTIMPGFTHLQTAQPVTFGHHCLAYVEMLERDRGRFADARARANECPLGAAALAGTSFPIDRQATAKALGFERPTANSLDSVSDRDFALEALSAAGLTALHLSRLAEEIVIWASAPFSFVALSDAFSTGSSIMPQKRNPDAAELVRAKTGRIIGSLTGLAMVMKGLPLAYSKDMQEDKEPVFDAFDSLWLSLAALSGMVSDLKVNTHAMEAQAGQSFSTATDLADWLVRALGKPFREAHQITGSLVALAEKKTCRLEELALSDMQKIEPGITNDVYSVLSLENSVNSRTSYGGTAPVNVAAQAASWRKKLS